MLAAEVLPNLSRLITTLSSGTSILRIAERIMRAFAWWGITYWTSSRREPVAGKKLLDHLGQYPDRELEDLAAVLEELLVVAGVAGPPQRRPATVGPEDVVHEAGLSVARIEHDGAGAIAEEDRGRAVLLDPRWCSSRPPR